MLRDFSSREKGQIAEGKFPGLHADKTRFEDLEKDLIDDYTSMVKGPLRVEISTKHLEGYFKGKLANEITSTHINKYIKARQKAGAANATVNRELSALKRMFTLEHGAHHRRSCRSRISLCSRKQHERGFYEYPNTSS